MTRTRWGAAVAIAALLGGAAVVTAAEEHRVEVRDDSFAEERVEVVAGDTVVWEQTGSNPHTVTADDGSFDSHETCPPNFADCMGEGDTFERAFPEPGEYAYHCKIHGAEGGQGMAGVVVVSAAAQESEPPTTEAPAPPADDPAPPPATAPAPTETASPADTDATGARLAATGAPLGVLAGVAAALLLGGLGMARVASRSRGT